MREAHVIVDLLLDDITPMMLVTGPELPDHGYIVTDNDIDRMMNRFLSDAGHVLHVDTRRGRATVINELIAAGYQILQRDTKGNVFFFSSHPQPIKSKYLQNYFQIQPDTPVLLGSTWPSPERRIVFSDIQKGKNGQDDTSEILSFGGPGNAPGGSYRQADPDTDAIKKGIEHGVRYAIKHAGSDSIAIVTPKSGDASYLTPEELSAIAHRFGVNPNKTYAEHYAGNVQTFEKVLLARMVKAPVRATTRTPAAPRAPLPGTVVPPPKI
jgi:hypothetical protein